jgi:hypothetical protein
MGIEQQRDARRESNERRHWRERQYARKARSQAWLLDRTSNGSGRLECSQFADLPRPARCGWPLTGTAVKLHNGKAYISGAEHCASPWCCPTCTPIIRSRRAQDLRAVIDYWKQDDKHAMAFVTLTAPHQLADPLKDMTRLVSRAWSLMRGSQPWRTYSREAGIRHYVRALEITWNAKHGWHAHLHILLMLDHGFDAKAMRRGIYKQWSDTLERLDPTRKPPSRRHGVTVQTVAGDSLQIADYMSKTPDRKDIASELARADRKKTRDGASLNPFQLLDEPTINALGEQRDKARLLWLEYVDATYRLRSITWSKNIRREAGLSATAPTDQQIIDTAVYAPTAFPLSVAQHRMLRRNPSIRAYVLQKTETGEIPLALQIIDDCA